MNNTFIKTTRLYLEPLEMKHFSEEYVSWLNSPDITKYNRHGIFPNTSSKTKQYIESVQNSIDNLVFAIIDQENNKHIGNVAVQNIDFLNSNADISIIIGSKEHWGKGFAFEIYTALFKYVFDKLNLNKIYIGTTQDNIAMQKVAIKLNMKKDGTKREAVYKNGRYLDIYEYSILKKEYLGIA